MLFSGGRLSLYQIEAKIRLRLLLFSALSELPFCMLFQRPLPGLTGSPYCGMNMIFTLFLCFCMVWRVEDIENVLLKVLIIFGAFYLSGTRLVLCGADVHADVPVAGKDEEKVKGAFRGGCTAPGAVQVHGGLRDLPSGRKLIYALKTWQGLLWQELP